VGTFPHDLVEQGVQTADAAVFTFDAAKFHRGIIGFLWLCVAGERESVTLVRRFGGPIRRASSPATRRTPK
jgi:hypothetical protein